MTFNGITHLTKISIHELSKVRIYPKTERNEKKFLSSKFLKRVQYTHNLIYLYTLL